ncbi:MAG: BON domain-containing protein [Polyangiaceae bacterium]|nr:BON domain-containing protein [Polyangiaceae bacterium]
MRRRDDQEEGYGFGGRGIGDRRYELYERWQMGETDDFTGGRQITRGDFGRDERSRWVTRSDHFDLSTDLDERRIQGPVDRRPLLPDHLQPVHLRSFRPRAVPRSDVRIHDHVCSMLWERRWLDTSDIDLRVEDGEVYLAGTVPERWMKFEIENVCASAEGVIDVSNAIRLRRPVS